MCDSSHTDKPTFPRHGFFHASPPLLELSPVPETLFFFWWPPTSPFRAGTKSHCHLSSKLVGISFLKSAETHSPYFYDKFVAIYLQHGLSLPLPHRSWASWGSGPPLSTPHPSDFHLCIPALPKQIIDSRWALIQWLNDSVPREKKHQPVKGTAHHPLLYFLSGPRM